MLNALVFSKSRRHGKKNHTHKSYIYVLFNYIKFILDAAL